MIEINNIIDSLKDEVMVSIRCTAYNQEPYIRQCLEGFVMQKTNFKFEAIVHDDASTDNTATIIKEYAEKYPDIIKPVIETENQYNKHDGSIDKIMDSYMRGKYVAFCQADDYWTDPLKLQKQVDFLEAHTEYTMSYTKNISYIQTSDIFYQSELNYLRSKLKDDITCEDIILRNVIPTLTVVMRTSILFQIRKSDPFIFESSNFIVDDLPMWYTASRLGKIHYLNEITGVYRILQNSASHIKGKKNRYRFSVLVMGLCAYLCRRDNLSPELCKFTERKYADRLFHHLALNPDYVPIVPLLPNTHKFLLFLHKAKLLRFYLLLDYPKWAIKYIRKKLHIRLQFDEYFN